ncbi:Carbon monoxide dehydrogenase small chain [Candidatus Desulfarcum epimagneticum]|uniref:Carbon monoxide dehydrogenase small chain n=1 Tax=uncultured Desulfobacteraceae bacterium TaxID=218296 RepID=A0A484HH66_9BACT|nr:Carbon monoxide dehydrogenase small chain [uncultured Desulfobacteraceae bacterium]
MSKKIVMDLNNEKVTVEIEENWTLLYLLREKLGLKGSKEGCGSGECGACSVIVDGAAVNSCIYPAPEAHGKKITTVEGLAAPDGTLHPLQKSFVENGGIQCGFCSPGMLMSSGALLGENPDPDEEEIKHALAGNICRCTGYVQIIESVKAAAAAITTSSQSKREP